MKIAVTFENGEIFQHFGHCEQFKMYDIEDNKIVSSEIVSTNGQGHGAITQFLADNNVDTLICGGIGGGAQNALAENNIKLFGGVSGSVDEAVNLLLAGNLSFNPPLFTCFNIISYSSFVTLQTIIGIAFRYNSSTNSYIDMFNSLSFSPSITIIFFIFSSCQLTFVY